MDAELNLGEQRARRPHSGADPAFAAKREYPDTHLYLDLATVTLTFRFYTQYSSSAPSVCGS